MIRILVAISGVYLWCLHIILLLNTKLFCDASPIQCEQTKISAVEANDRGNNVNAEVQIDQKKNRTE